MPTYQLGALSSDFERTFGEPAGAFEDRKPRFNGSREAGQSGFGHESPKPHG